MTLKHFIDLRFIASQYDVIRAFLLDLPVIVQELARHRDESGGLTRIKLNGLLNQCRSFKFVTTCIGECDIDEALKVLSKRGQSNSALCIDVPEWYSSTKGALRKLRTSLGGLGCEYLKELSDGKVCSRMIDKDGDESEPSIYVKLTHRPRGTAAVRQRLLRYQVVKLGLGLGWDSSFMTLFHHFHINRERKSSGCSRTSTNASLCRRSLICFRRRLISAGCQWDQLSKSFLNHGETPPWTSSWISATQAWTACASS